MERSSSLELTGVALITGAGSGIGEACAHAFAREGIKAAVLCDVNSAGLEKVATGLVTTATNPRFETLTLVVDVSKEAECQRMVNEAVARFGRIDYAVNCAGITRPRCTVDEYLTAAYQAIIDVNLSGVFYCMRAELAQMLKQEPSAAASITNPNIKGSRGSIVNIASICSVVGVPGGSAYVASKHGVIGLTKTAAAEHAANEIRINAVLPGFIRTPLMVTPIQLEALDRIAKYQTPARRSGEAEEVAAIVVFQSSPR
ncbi:oxidoreductase [Calocera viscosa TUFC12733]|uniref:Oxidoreductase n=1 Tax=Calocera viscosa (strain TUFC12733) TaxID=1330018 RepID=A0A167HB58_CALVF|nr:oxidoreductase [Calocera viscosa TUFC12733]